MAAASGTFSGRWVTPSGCSGDSGRALRPERDAVWSYVAALRLPHYFRLGLVGFLGTLAWLAVPAILIASGGRRPVIWEFDALRLRDRSLFALSSGPLRRRGTSRLPYSLDAQSASGFAAPLGVRVCSRGAAGGGGDPLYLLKIEMVPRDAAWLPSLVFVIFLAPADCSWGGRTPVRDAAKSPVTGSCAGWADSRSSPPRCSTSSWFSSPSILRWEGVTSLYDQHAFLLPVPFLNM